MSVPVSELSVAVTSGDAGAVRAVLERHPHLKATLDAPMPGGSFDQQALLIAASRGRRDVLDVLDRYHDLERWVTYHLIEPLWDAMLQEHPQGGRASPSGRAGGRTPAATDLAVGA